MSDLRRLVGSLNNLQTFESAVRNRKFTNAAAELGVSQPAISRSIRELEAHLGRSLFNRNGTRTSLTTEGIQLFEAVEAAFGQIERTVRQFTQRSETAIVTFRVSVAASRWLLPALGSFYTAHPDTRLHMVCLDEMHAEHGAEFDMEIRFGNGKWDRCEIIPLLDEVVIPVCAPSLFEQIEIKDVDDMAAAPLLQVGNFTGPLMDWKNWIPNRNLPNTRTLTTYAMVLEAAELGHGLALGWKYYVAEAIDKGRLIPMLNMRDNTELQEYLVIPDHRSECPHVRSVADWVRGFAATTRARYRHI